MGMLREPYVGLPFPAAGNKWLGGTKRTVLMQAKQGSHLVVFANSRSTLYPEVAHHAEPCPPMCNDASDAKPQRRLDARPTLGRTSSNTKVAGLEYHSPGKAQVQSPAKGRPRKLSP